jgi:outer membrane protein assembly factor BamA
MTTHTARRLLLLACVVTLPAPARAQGPVADTRQAIVEQAQAQKAQTLRPYAPSRFERLVTNLENALVNNTATWHPFMQNAYDGGGFSLGAGYRRFTGANSFVDTRGSVSLTGYTLAEAEFVSPRLFQRRGSLSVSGGWRNATRVGFYGLGMDTSADDRTNFAFEQPFASTRLTFWPTRRLIMLRGGVEGMQWKLTRPTGGVPSIDTRYTPSTLPGLGSTTTVVHTDATVALDTRASPGYARRGGFYGATAHDFADTDSRFGFRQIDYEVVQHVPIWRETWVLSFRGAATTTFDKQGQDVPFFLLPSLGGGSSLRSFSSWRFRDRNSLLLQGEWRIMANRVIDTAVFVDAGKVTARRQDLDFDRLETGYGFGARFHGPFFTGLRIDLTRGPEGTRLVFAASPAF